MIRSMPLVDDLGQSRKGTPDPSAALFLAQSLHSHRPALKLRYAHASLGAIGRLGAVPKVVGGFKVDP
ncbi:hypothetical protein IVB40_22510 [Bradyrhizobium sp. 40]|uniref:hypothetical protein n=1 Tax=Bradyrhizobium sp. 40 TaxID=2782674 RepID=UPI001FFF3AC2|nr:hypothetical protein [Bradyrhizobium sp. 40]UPJ40090.1 hypothetical protein IVB40_22510 [Bradyrhizobium sp. 40]